MGIFFLVLGVIIGFFLTILFLYLNAQKLMFRENKSPFGFDDTVNRLNSEIEGLEWKVLGQYDLQEKMRANGYDVIQSKVFDLCKPSYASQILMKDSERIVSPLMPCRIAVYLKSDGITYISRLNSALMAKPLKGIVPQVMGQAASDIEIILKPFRL